MKIISVFSPAVLLVLGWISLSYSAYLDLAWNPNGEADLAGYRLYYGTSSGDYGSPIDAGNVTTYRLTGLNDGVRYYAALTAYDTSNNESVKSVEINGIPITSSTSTVSSTSTTTILPTTTTTPGTTTQPPSTSTSTVQPTTSTTAPATTTTTPGTTTRPPSTSTSTVQPTTSTTAPATTTTTPGTTTQPPSTSTSTIVTNTTTSIEGETVSCDEPQKLLPASLTASSELHPFFGIDNLVDGNPQTTWSTLLSFFKKDASITMDMGSSTIITSLSLYASSLFGIDVLPSNIELQLSNDNVNWETVSRNAFSSSLHPPYADSWQLKNHRCRYLKVCITGSQPLFFFQLARIAELEIYGCDQAADFLSAAANHESSETVASNTRKRTLPHRSGPIESAAPGMPGTPLVTVK